MRCHHLGAKPIRALAMHQIIAALSGGFPGSRMKRCQGRQPWFLGHANRQTTGAAARIKPLGLGNHRDRMFTRKAQSQLIYIALNPAQMPAAAAYKSNFHFLKQPEISEKKAW
jgi:hypothetical protein